mmetsp:Transcript_31650/g.52349  ORF Transcript_31650/g.52349 Transcript_31650/m.52349 type:complete len:368 (+) Transcript_31650:237-1340(+)|eukprot:CAMPEP_0119320328 /NCGR_PEP_ID=MMETSP1333-20130426/52134_1 /TAXON_ID=418940 /ORGANISM="Scyphosphaera apsteinii, Strain RCC1455" /LENGTH=367 /DNA_ID=CAMNT_0007327025 /DNA_START=237 /DNA_END=1340 /DNA_ORIENTATION=+
MGSSSDSDIKKCSFIIPWAQTLEAEQAHRRLEKVLEKAEKAVRSVESGAADTEATLDEVQTATKEYAALMQRASVIARAFGLVSELREAAARFDKAAFLCALEKLKNTTEEASRREVARAAKEAARWAEKEAAMRQVETVQMPAGVAAQDVTDAVPCDIDLGETREAIAATFEVVKEGWYDTAQEQRQINWQVGEEVSGEMDKETTAGMETANEAATQESQTHATGAGAAASFQVLAEDAPGQEESLALGQASVHSNAQAPKSTTCSNGSLSPLVRFTSSQGYRMMLPTLHDDVACTREQQPGKSVAACSCISCKLERSRALAAIAAQGLEAELHQPGRPVGLSLEEEQQLIVLRSRCAESMHEAHN